MVDWLGIGHLFELSRMEATLGFFTPLAIFGVFFLAQLLLPGRWVPGYFPNPWAWTYFVFIVPMFAYRQRVDNRHCAEKFGAEKWAKYQARVQYRIVPGVTEKDPCGVRWCRAGRG